MDEKITYTNLPQESSPAFCDLQTGCIIVNVPKFARFDDFTRRYILNHERGHLALQTLNEIEADEYAFNKMVGKEPYSLRKSVSSLKKALPFTTPNHYTRLDAQIFRALEWDAANGNLAAAKELEKNRYAGFDYNPYQGSEMEKIDTQLAQLINLKAGNDLLGENTLLNPSILPLLVVFIVVLLFTYFFK